MPSSGLREKPKKQPRIIAWVLVVAWAALIFVLSSIPGTSYPSHPEAMNVVAHFVLYMVLGVLLTVALGHTKMALWKVALIAIAIASLYGASDEFHQLFTPFRNCDPMDWLVDTVAGTGGAALAVFYISAKRVSRSRRKDSKLDKQPDEGGRK